jgi:hypothetical protein
VRHLVNLDFNKFKKEQKNHKPEYLDNNKAENVGGFNKSNYNSQENTDKSVGAVGRNETLR